MPNRIASLGNTLSDILSKVITVVFSCFVFTFRWWNRKIVVSIASSTTTKGKVLNKTRIAVNYSLKDWLVECVMISRKRFM